MNIRKDRYVSNYATNCIKTKHIRKFGSELRNESITKNANRQFVSENFTSGILQYIYLVASRLQKILF